MKCKVIDPYFVDLDDFEGLVVCGSSMKKMLESWMSIEERVSFNLEYYTRIWNIPQLD